MVSTRRRRANADRRARAALGWGLVLFVLVQLGVRLLLQSDPELAEREFGRKLACLRTALAEAPGRPLILTLGSSRMATAFRPDVLPRLPAIGGQQPLAFNFAIVGSGPELSHLVLYRLLAAGIRPAWVFFEYWPPLWSTDRTWNQFRTQINVGLLDPRAARLLAGYLVRPRTLYRAWFEAQVAPVYAHRSALLRRYAPAWVEEKVFADFTVTRLDRLGWWSPRDTANADYDRALLARMLALYSPILAKLQTKSAPDRALRATRELCRREQIGFSVVVLPEGDAFRSCYPPHARETVEAYLDRVRREYGVEVIDARTWIAEAEFMDSHHLFPQGATHFTRRFGRALNESRLARSMGPVRTMR